MQLTKSWANFLSFLTIINLMVYIARVIYVQSILWVVKSPNNPIASRLGEKAIDLADGDYQGNSFMKIIKLIIRIVLNLWFIPVIGVFVYAIMIPKII